MTTRRRRCPQGHLARTARSQRERGFTLIEMMIALAIFMVGLAGVVSLQVVSANGAQSANELSLATNIASAKIEQLNVTDFDALADGSDSYTKQGVLDVSASYFTAAWTVTVVGVDLKDVAVTVSWTLDGSARSVALASRRAR